MDRSLPSGFNDQLIWCEKLNYGWHSSPPMEYSGEYFAHYQKLDATPMGEALTRSRLELVSKFTNPNDGVDIGVGGGRYVLESKGYGFDVSGEAAKWLRKQGLYIDPYATKVQSITCWDSLEHIPEPEKLLAQVTNWFFVSLPTFEDAAEALRSKHFKPREHLWYFSIVGLIDWADRQGFQVMEVNHAETELGREGITSFAFKRVAM